MTDTAPLKKTLTADTIAVAAGSDATVNLGPAPFAGKVVSATFIPNGAITGADTNTRTLKIINKGQAGAGTTAVAELALASGVNASASDEKALTLSGTPANLVVAEGDVLAYASTHAASGLADPGGEVRVQLERT